jgi:hypothetical protein
VCKLNYPYIAADLTQAADTLIKHGLATASTTNHHHTDASIPHPNLTISNTTAAAVSSNYSTAAVPNTTRLELEGLLRTLGLPELQELKKQFGKAGQRAGCSAIPRHLSNKRS